MTVRLRRAVVGRLVVASTIASTVAFAASVGPVSAAPSVNPHIQVQGSPACRSNSSSDLWRTDNLPVSAASAFQIADAANKEMFVVGSDGRVYHDYYDPTSGPVGWSTLGSPAAGIVGAVRNGTNYAGNQELYVRAKDGQVYHLYATPGVGSGWQGWDPLGSPAGGIRGDVVEGTNNANNQELYVLGNDGNVYHKFATPGLGTGWSNWDTMSHPNGVTVTGDVQIGINYICNQELFVTGTDGLIYHKFATPGQGSGWSEWSSLGQPSRGIVGSVAAGENFSNNQELFVIGADRQVYHDYSTPGQGSGWSGWAPLGAPSGTITSTFVLVDTYPQQKLTITTTTGTWIDVATPGQGLGWSGWVDPAAAAPLGTLVNFRNGPSVSVTTPKFGEPTSYAYVPSVMLDGGVYKMWFCGSPNDTIYYTTSPTVGGPWSTPTAVLSQGAAGKFDSILTCDPSVVKVNGTFYLYYGGSPFATTPPNGQWGTQGVGLATSTDGVNFQRANNGDAVRTPAKQSPRSGCAFNSYGAGQPSALYKDGLFYLLYEDTSAAASTCASSNGMFLIRSSDPTFQSGTQDWNGSGWVGDGPSTKAGAQFGIGYVSADWMYSDVLGRFIVALNGNGGSHNTEMRLYNPDFSISKPDVENLPLGYSWSEGPGLARTPDGHAPANPNGVRNVPIDEFYSTGSIGSTTQSNIVTSGADMGAG